MVLHADRDVVAEAQSGDVEELGEPVGAVVELAVGDHLAGARHDVGGLVRVRLSDRSGPHGRTSSDVADRARRSLRLVAMAIISWGTYLPESRLDRGLIGAALGTPAGAGTRSVAAYDEDTTSMG